MSTITNDATNLVDAVNGKLYTWSASPATGVPAAKALCATTPSTPGITWGPGLLVTYNTFEENLMVEDYFRGTQGAKAYYIG